MAIVSKETLKSYFQPPHVPIQSNYVDFIDTMGSFPPIAHVHTASDIDGGQPVFTTLGSSGDFSVGLGSGVLFVDVSGQNVGINCTPDPQFDLDVAGGLRAGVLYGPIGRVLKNAVLISHFDGESPFSENFSGQLTGHMGQVPTQELGAIFREGKFNKAVQVAKGSTNLIMNPSPEVDTWFWYATSETETFQRTMTALPKFGKYVFMMAETSSLGSNEYAYTNYIPVIPNTAYTASAWIRQFYSSSDRAQIVIWYYNSSGTVLSSEGTYFDYGSYNEDPWRRFSITSVAPATAANARVGIVMRLPVGAAGSIYFDAVQFEKESYPTPYIQGDLGPGHSWTGTPFQSTSVRIPSGVSYSFDYQDFGTVMGWFYNDQLVDRKYRAIFQLIYDTNNRIGIFNQVADGTSDCGHPYLWTAMGGTTKSVTPGFHLSKGWHHVAFTFDIPAKTYRFFIDGVYVGSAVNTGTFLGRPNKIQIGHNDLSGQLDSFLDDFALTYDILSDAEILAIATSDAPVAASSSTFAFRSGGSNVWADKEGLWIKDSDGQAVFGAYTISGSKSWGGATLNMGDILFGRIGASDGAWFLFDRDGISYKPYIRIGYGTQTVWRFDSGGATLDGVFDLTTTGGIYQGTGTFASPLTGLKVWNESGVGKIGGFSGGNPQWYADTDGVFKAGGGNVALSASGFSIKSTAFGSVTQNQIKFISATGSSPGSSIGIIEGYQSGAINNYLNIETFKYDGLETHLYLSTPSTSDIVAYTRRIYNTGDLYVEGVTITYDDIRTTGDIFSEEYQSYSPTFVGWSSISAAYARYKKVGKLVFVEFYINGTGDANTPTMTLPTYSGGNRGFQIYAPVRCQNGPTNNVFGIAGIPNSGNIVTFYSTAAGGGWSAGVARQINGHFWYDANA